MAYFCIDPGGVSVLDAGMVEARKEASTGVVVGDEGTVNSLALSVGLNAVCVCGDEWVMQVVVLLVLLSHKFHCIRFGICNMLFPLQG